MEIDVSLPPTHEQVPSAVSERTFRAEEGEVSLLDLLIVLLGRKGLILRTTAIFAVIAIAISFIWPKSYTATATILPPQQNSSMATMLASQLGNMGNLAALAGGGGMGAKSQNDMLVGLMKSRTVEDAVIQRFGLMQEYRAHLPSDARKKLEKRVTIDGTGKDGLIRISMDDHDPRRASELVNGYIDQFRKLSEHLAITEASQRRLFFEQQLAEAKDNLANAEDEMKRVEQQTGVIQPDSQTRALIESAAFLRAQITAKEVQIRSLETFATDQNSQLVRAQEELESLRGQLAKLGGSENGADASLIVPKGKVPELGLEYLRKLRNVRYYETVFQILARQFEMAKLDEARQGSLIQVVDSAIPPDRRSSPKRALIVIGLTALGFLVGALSAFAAAGFERLNEDRDTGEKVRLIMTLMSFRKARFGNAL